VTLLTAFLFSAYSQVQHTFIIKIVKKHWRRKGAEGMRKYYFLISLMIIVISWMVFSKTNRIIIEQLDDTGTVKITVNFLIHMAARNVEDKIHFTSERPGVKIIKNARWLNDSTLEIFAVEEGLPRGFLTRLYIEPLKTRIPGLYKSAKALYRANISPFLIGLSPVAPTRGPIVLNFSTPIKKEGLTKYLETDFKFTLKPGMNLGSEGRFFKDYSKWYILPEKGLEPGKSYRLDFDGYMENFTGMSKKVEFSRAFKAATVPQVVSTSPSDGQKDVPVYGPVIINFDVDMAEVAVKIGGMTGDTVVQGRTATYKPHAAFLPGRTYEAEICGKSLFGEVMKPLSFNFSIMDMGDKLWVEVNLRRLQKVVIYRGARAIRTMLVSGGLPGLENETPLGYFTIKDRGESFWSEKYEEGALYWVRIKGDFLFHSIPRDLEGNIIEEEYKKLGIPASHGCIRMRDEDARWFYENVPEGAMVVIHD
jgi:lipoprotein-anchoring transpeptidase ErfK/SrfK